MGPTHVATYVPPRGSLTILSYRVCGCGRGVKGDASDEGDEVRAGEAGEGGGAPGGLTSIREGLPTARSLMPQSPLTKEVAGMTTLGAHDARRGARVALASMVLRSKAVMVLVGERWRSAGGGVEASGRGGGGGMAIFVFMMIRAEVGTVVGDGSSASRGRGGEREGFRRVGWGGGGCELARLLRGLESGEGRAGGRASKGRGDGGVTEGWRRGFGAALSSFANDAGGEVWWDCILEAGRPVGVMKRQGVIGRTKSQLGITTRSAYNSAACACPQDKRKPGQGVGKSGRHLREMERNEKCMGRALASWAGG